MGYTGKYSTTCWTCCEPNELPFVLFLRRKYCCSIAVCLNENKQTYCLNKYIFVFWFTAKTVLVFIFRVFLGRLSQNCWVSQCWKISCETLFVFTNPGRDFKSRFLCPLRNIAWDEGSATFYMHFRKEVKSLEGNLVVWGLFFVCFVFCLIFF